MPGFNEGAIGRCQLVEVHLGTINPGQRIVLPRAGLAAGLDLDELDEKLGAGILPPKENFPDIEHFYAELFGQLASCSRKVVLRGLEFPTREFPEPSMTLVTRALCNQICLIPLNY